MLISRIKLQDSPHGISRYQVTFYSWWHLQSWSCIPDILECTWHTDRMGKQVYGQCTCMLSFITPLKFSGRWSFPAPMKTWVVLFLSNGTKSQILNQLEIRVLSLVIVKVSKSIQCGCLLSLSFSNLPLLFLIFLGKYWKKRETWPISKVVLRVLVCVFTRASRLCFPSVRWYIFLLQIAHPFLMP